MKRTNYFTLAALAVLSLAGCTQDDERAAGLPMTGMPLRVVAHVDAPVTREAMTTETLDHYYFLVTDQDGATTPEYDYFVEMIKGKDGQWSASKEMTWGTAYPKVSAWEQKGTEWIKDNYTGGSPVNVGIYQSTREYLLESDLLYMPPTDITAANLDADGNIRVNLKHRFAKLNIVVNITGTPSNPINELTIGGTKPQANFTPKTNTLGVYGYAEDITAYCASSTTNDTDDPSCTATYECILIPQELETSTLKVTATLQDGSSKSYTHDKALTLKENCQYTLTLSMTYNGTLKPSDNINVGNWGDEEETGEGELEEGAQIENGTYIVKNAKGLLEWAQAAAQGNSPSLTLTADIDMKGRTWPIIKSYTGGTINGQGYAIKNLTLTPSDDNCAGLIAENASNCTIENLTLWKPSIITGASSMDCYGFFVGEEAEDITMENCHVVSGSCSARPYNTPGGLVGYANGGTYTACSVVSSGVGLWGEGSDPDPIAACYVVGSTLGSFNTVYYEHVSRWCSSSYYQETADGSITGVGSSSAVSDWTGAMNAMNGSLGGQTYQWVENTVTDDDPRPLIIQDKPTN